jgi:hypothetical protein
MRAIQPRAGALWHLKTPLPPGKRPGVYPNVLGGLSQGDPGAQAKLAAGAGTARSAGKDQGQLRRRGNCCGHAPNLARPCGPVRLHFANGLTSNRPLPASLLNGELLRF